MSIEIGVLIGLAAATVSILAFFFARLADAEARGVLKQRVTDLEKRQEKLDQKIDKILEKLESINEAITRLFAERKKECKE